MSYQPKPYDNVL